MKKTTAAKAPAKPAPGRTRPPIAKLPREVEALWEQGDWLGLEEQHRQWLRGKKELSAEERRELKEHDDLEARLQNDPKTLLYETSAAIHAGLLILAKLIHSRQLRRQIYYTGGSLYGEDDETCDQFTMIIEAMNRWLTKFAREGCPGLRETVFLAAKELTESFMLMAQTAPGDFISVAESSLTMPSLRARNPGFTADAAVIAKAIHLGEKHPAPDITDNRSRAGAHSHLLVAKVLEAIHFARREYEWKKETLERLQKFSEAADHYRDVTLEDYLRSNYYPDKFDHLMACAALPPWEENAMAWWAGRVRPMIRAEFAALARDPGRHPVLWEELGKGGETRNSTENDRRRYLEKLCLNKFSQFARPARRTPARGQ